MHNRLLETGFQGIPSAVQLHEEQCVAVELLFKSFLDTQAAILWGRPTWDDMFGAYRRLLDALPIEAGEVLGKWILAHLVLTPGGTSSS